MAEQLINMKKSNDIDLNFISYVFQSNRISVIKNIYIKKEKDFENFLSIFNGKKIKKILVKRLEWSRLTVKMNDLIKEKKYYDFFKILFLKCDDDDGLGKFLFVLIDYISEYQSFDINISKNVNLLYKNVMEFNCQNFFISDLIDNMNIKHSIPYINLFNLYKIPFFVILNHTIKKKLSLFKMG